MPPILSRFARSESGATTLGSALNAKFASIGAKVTSAGS